jgi:hypothetical protein
VTILGRGDLAPPRRGRRRRTPFLAALLLLAALAAGGWYAWRTWTGGGHDSVRTKQPHVVCVTPTPSSSPAPIKGVKVAVLNGTARAGLAHTIAGQLTLRGFAVVKVGNGPAASGPPRVTYAPGEVALAMTLAEQVRGATLYELSNQPPGVVELRISSGFGRLATRAEAAAARAHDVAAAAPSPAVCTTPSG